VKVTQVVPNGAAATAGMQANDEVVAVDGRPSLEVFFGGGFRTMYGEKPAGTLIPVSVKRGDQTLTLQVPLRFGAAAAKVVEDPAAPPRAIRLRDGLLRGTTDR
jgi:predicted metalloprotease with PDZ domain